MITRTVGSRTYTYSHSIGLLATAGKGFRFPVDLGFGPEDAVYVLNRGNTAPTSARVTKCTLDEDFIMTFGSYGSEDGQLLGATALAVDGEENIYVADEYLTRISIYDKDGTFLGKWGTRGSEYGQLHRPWGLVFDEDQCLWVVDSGNGRVQRFTREGKFLSAWGRSGDGDGELNMPWGITIDAVGSVYIADWYNSRVQKYTPDGEYLMTFGGPGSGAGELRRPSGVAVDGDGDVYVTDWGEDKVHVYGPDGSHVTTFLGDAKDPSKWAQAWLDANPDYQKARNRVKSRESEWRFSYPVAVKVGREGKVVIADQQRMRLQIYVKEKEYVEPQFNL